MTTTQPNLITVIDPSSLIKSKNPVYSDVMVVQLSETVKQINISGQVALRLDGTVPNTLSEQMDVCLDRINTCLTEVGAQQRDIVRLMYYFTEEAWKDPEALDLVVEKMAVLLKGHRPTSCCLIVKSLSEPKFLCEFEAQAYIGTT